jgi:tetratricopeptide (TPR) repeat protein
MYSGLIEGFSRNLCSIQGMKRFNLEIPLDLQSLSPCPCFAFVVSMNGPRRISKLKNYHYSDSVMNKDRGKLIKAHLLSEYLRNNDYEEISAILRNNSEPKLVDFLLNSLDYESQMNARQRTTLLSEVSSRIEDPKILKNLGDRYFELEEYRRAADVFNRLDFQSLSKLEGYQIKRKLALALFNLGEVDRAINILELRRLTNDSVDSHLEYVSMIERSGRSVEAFAELLRLEKRFPYAVGIPIFKGNILLDQGRYEEAEVEFLKALSLDGRSGWADFRIGVLRLSQQRYLECAQWIQSAVDKGYDRPWIQGYLNRCRNLSQQQIFMDPKTDVRQ